MRAEEAEREGSGGRAGRHRASARSGTARRKQEGLRRFGSLDATNNVRLLTADLPAETAPDEIDGGENADVAAPAAALPLPDYDGLSLPSVRARLRGLDAAQVKALLEHEQLTANRTDFISMLQRKIAKLDASTRDAT